jgi:glycine oxidase
MDRQRDVLIIGGGVIGLTTAYYLAQDGVRVTVVDKGDLGREASWAGAGIIAPGNPERATGDFNLLRAHSSWLFPQISEILRGHTGHDNGYRVCGGVELASGIDDATMEEWRSEGIAYERLTASKLARIEPAFAEISEDGFYLPSMAQVRNPWHLKALISACEHFHVELLRHRPVLRLEHGASRVECAHTEAGSLGAETFLVAAGPWTDPLLQPLGWRPNVFPVRGQMVLLRAEQTLFKTMLLNGKRYLVPRTDGRVLAGSTEEDVGFDKSTTKAGTGMLRDMAYKLIPALRDVPIEATWSGLRPATPDGIPRLGKVPGTENLYVAAGHFRSGIQLSPATGLVMSQLLQGKPTLVPLDAFSPARELLFKH